MASLALPTWLGFAIPPAFQHFVLVFPSARIDRPRHFDTRRVIKADQLRKAIWRDVDNENPLLGILRTAAKFVSSDTLEAVARQLAAMHQPAGDGASARDARVAATPPPVAQAVEAPPVVEAAAAPVSPPQPALPACKSCGGREGQVCYGKFGYYLKCSACQTNTAIRFTCLPGHHPRLRKSGLEFFRDCPECGTSDLVHRNKA